MISKSVVAKIWLTIVCMVAFVLLLVSVLLQQFFDQYLRREQAMNLYAMAQVVQRMALRDPDLSLVHAITPDINVVQNADIAVAYPLASNKVLQQAYNAFTPAERKVFQAGKPVIRHSSSAGSDTLAVYLKIPGSQESGMVLVKQQSSVLAAPIASIRNILIFALVLGVILTTGLAFVISKHLSRPLVQMNEAAERMAQGDFSRQVNVVTSDEVGRLGHTFNKLAQQLAQTIAALSMERDQLSSILSSLEDGVIAVNLSGEITLANPPALRRLSTAWLEETGDPDGNVLPPSLMRMMESVMATRQSKVEDMRWQGRFVMVTMMPLYESDAIRLRGIVTVLRDVTEERRLNRLRKDFLANVSHELRTPLSMMQGYAEALLDDFGNNRAQQRELAEIIHDETLRMRRLVNDILDLAQLESGQFQMTFAPLDLCSLVRRTGRKFMALSSDRGIQLCVEVSDVPVMIKGDADRIDQVLINLIDNALRHTDPGGRVRIAVHSSGRHARLVVSDTGHGIPAEDIPYIWERFYKADKARTRGGAGTGLGLAITRQIVSEHNGDVIVDSDLGRGTTFTVVIPLLT
ncbi:MAG: cell wall metabolism sensor histidine kinase WalK [Alicyclobacillus sp.]|nr:cell wall metabolism sensor histidine kinase WalK [Alicyclobacillus sp.]